MLCGQMKSLCRCLTSHWSACFSAANHYTQIRQTKNSFNIQILFQKSSQTRGQTDLSGHITGLHFLNNSSINNIINSIFRETGSVQQTSDKNTDRQLVLNITVTSESSSVCGVTYCNAALARSWGIRSAYLITNTKRAQTQRKISSVLRKAALHLYSYIFWLEFVLNLQLIQPKTFICKSFQHYACHRVLDFVTLNIKISSCLKCFAVWHLLTGKKN